MTWTRYVRPACAAGLLLSALLGGCAPSGAAPTLPGAPGPTAGAPPAATEPASPTPPATATPDPLRLSVVADSPDPGLAEALQAAGWNVSVEPAGGADALRAAARSGAAVVVADGAGLSELAAAAADFPSVYFIGHVAAPAPEPGLPGNALAFSEADARQDQAGFLAGLVAGLATDADRVAVIAPSQDPVGLKYRNGFLSGVRYACPPCRLDSVDLADPADEAAGAAEGAKYAALGADVVFAGPGPAGLAALEAAAAAGAWVIEAGEGSAKLTGGQLLARVFMDWPGAARAALDDQRAGRPRSGVEPLALANGAVQITPLAAAGPLLALDLQEFDQIRGRLADRSLETGVDPLTGAER